VILEHRENNELAFDGTIIDIETIGGFSRGFRDSRQYANIQPVIFGYINGQELRILTAQKNSDLAPLRERLSSLLNGLSKPFHAFNCEFEMGVLFHNLQERHLFERELNQEKFEAKKKAVSLLKIPQYGDPFNDKGFLCIQAWENGNLNKAIAHNRSCLLKERDILLKRGFRKPAEFEFVDK